MRTTRTLLALSKLKGIGPSAIREMIGQVDIENSSVAEFAKLNSKVSEALEMNEWDEATRWADRQMEVAEQNGFKIVTLVDGRYPSQLRAISDPPPILFSRGSWPAIHGTSIAIIGARAPTIDGISTTKEITAYFVSSGYSIISGLALGCDTIAHEQCLTLRGHTVAVLAHGLHTIAPKENTRLAEEIIEAGGLLLTEYPFGVNPHSYQFVRRDRIQAGLALGVIMIQSGVRGGSLHASRAAIKFGRTLAVPEATPFDLQKHIEAVRANQVLFGGCNREKAELLKCAVSDLKKLVLLRSKSDYARLCNYLTAIPSRKSQTGPVP